MVVLESVIHKILRPIVLQAFQVVLHTALGFDVSVDEIKRVIVGMKIYSGQSYDCLQMYIRLYLGTII